MAEVLRDFPQVSDPFVGRIKSIRRFLVENGSRWQRSINYGANNIGRQHLEHARRCSRGFHLHR